MSQYPTSPPQGTLPSCYRHPGSPAGVVCQRCDRPICPQCMNTASVGFHCPECAHKGAQKVYRGPSVFAGQRPIVTQVLIAVNVAIFLLDQVLRVHFPGGDIGWFTYHGELFGPLVKPDPYRLLTAGFLHANILHIAFNMYALWVLGRVLEVAIGRLQFVAVYFASMLTGSLGVVILSPSEATVGASGAIFGLLGALLVLAKRRNATQVVNSLLITLGLNLVITISIPGISIGGHLGGVVGGALCGFVLLEAEDRVRSKVVPSALVAGIGIAAGVVAFALMSAKYA